MAPPRLPENVRKSSHTRMENILQAASAHTEKPLSLSEAKVYRERLKDLMVSAEEAHNQLIQVVVDAEGMALQDAELQKIDTTYTKASSLLEDIIVALTPQQASTSTATKLNIKLPQITPPEFDGKYSSWISFKDLFRASIDSNSQLQESQKLQYLKSCLKEEPASIIRNLTVTDANYQEAWRLLNARYDNKREIVLSWVDKLFSVKGVTREDPVGLQHLLDNTNECIRALAALGIPTDTLSDTFIVYTVTKKLDPATRREWAIRNSSSAVPTFQELSKFLLNHIRGLQASGVSSQPRSQPGQRHVKVHHTSTYKCRVCEGDHPHYQCKTFLGQTVQERKATAAKLKLCFNCLRDSHSWKNCPGKSTCKTCNRRHHTLLHEHDTAKPTAPSADGEATTSAPAEVESIHVSSSCHVLLQTAVVHVPDRWGNLRPCRALLDTGSQGSFITQECAAQLRLPCSASSIRVSGIGENQGGSTKGSVRAQLTSTSKPPKSLEVELNILPKLTRQLPSVLCTNTRWTHTDGLPLADPAYHTPQKVDILIGADHYHEVVLDGRRTGPPGTPVAQQTIFGWVLSGPTPIASNPIQIFHSTNEWEILRRFWEVEEPPHANLMTKEERACEEHFAATHKRDPSGRFVVTIPFNDRLRELGESRASAVKRLVQVEKRLSRNPKYIEPYRDFMAEYERLGHMERVPPEDLLHPKGPVFYIPHHFVTNEDSSTTKVRVVFDASAKTTTGVSLNDTIMVGPTVQSDLYTILLRFRRNKVAMKADIEKMFRMFRLNSSQTDTHRILWRPTPNDPIVEYRLLTVTYGTAYATHLATRCLKELANVSMTSHNAASTAIDKDTYVDDLISGARDVVTATNTFDQLTEVMQSAQLNLRKWSSNSKDFLTHIPEELRETDPFNFDNGDSTKTLGVMWDPCQDEFFFRHIRFDEPARLTKRRLLSNIARVFDPLGLISPVTLQGKLMLQELWKDPHGWDEVVPDHIQQLYEEYKAGFHDAPSLKFPRRLTADDAIRYELHGFSDASEKAYGAVVYIRIVSPGGVGAALASSKTRVSPIKQVCLPRLELMAAYLLAELVSEVLRILQADFEVNLWSDSTIALSWIHGQPHRWKTFVANRVARIQELTPVTSWRHVPGVQNPADLCSRGCSVQELISSRLWFHGPDWLSGDNIPDQPWNGAPPPEVEAEARPVPVTVHATMADIDWTERYSSLTRLNRVCAFVQRALHNFRYHDDRIAAPLSSFEMRTALHTLVRLSQEVAYPAEVAALRGGHPIPANSKLKTLFPFLDQEGILRVSSRLRHAQIPEDRKHLLILPAKSHLTTLVIQDAHRRTLHGGLQVTWATINQQFWIPAGRGQVRYFIRSCVTCRRHRAEAAEQLMGTLPETRVTISKPFSHAGVDYAGPFTLKNPVGRAPKTYKGYFCIFVCLATRAIHIEAVSALTTEAFLEALLRFAARRGIPAHLHSDHGTNFVGAEKELGQLLSEWKKRKDIPDHLATKGIQWHWAPPSAPHHNGMAEAGVKSAKHHLRRIMGNVPYTYEAFSTLLCQVEAILNSRPIHPMSSDPTDLSALTPGHFLVGEPLLQLPSPDLRDIPASRLSQFQRQQLRVQQFWERWSQDFLNTLHQRNKWYTQKENLSIGDLVLIREDTAPGTWKMARVLELHKGPDDLCRVVTLRTSTTTLKRPIVKLIPLLKAE